MKNRKIEILVIMLILLLQTSVYILCGTNKAYLHMDEAYSFGLASYDKTEIQNNDDFYDKWHNADYYSDYLMVDNDEKFDYSPVYENQKNDVHPPLYYLFLRFFMGFFTGEVAFWPGLLLNMIINLFTTVFIYFIAQKLLSSQKYIKEKSAFVALVTALTLSSISNVMYIRMYGLVTLIIVITVYLHLYLRDIERLKPRYLLLLGITVLSGSLTHYYYFFFLFPLFALFVIKYYRIRSHRNMLMYIATFVLASVVSLKIFPHSLDHLFSGYRGEGAASNLLSFAELQNRIFEFLAYFNKYGFNMMFFVVFGLIMLLQHCRKSPSVPVISSRGVGFAFVCIPCAAYFAIVSVCSPYVELRYILPVAVLIVASAICYLIRLLANVAGEKMCGCVSVVLAVLMLISPFFLDIAPKYIYADRADVVERLSENKEVPALYAFNSNNNRFLDDIYLFSKMDRSFIAKDLELNEENIKSIFANIDTSKGIVLFINEGWHNDNVLQIMVSSLGLDFIEHISRLNSCDVYIIQ